MADRSIHRVSAQVRTQCFVLLRAREHHEARWVGIHSRTRSSVFSAVALECFHVQAFAESSMPWPLVHSSSAWRSRCDQTVHPTSILIGPRATSDALGCAYLATGTSSQARALHESQAGCGESHGRCRLTYPLWFGETAAFSAFRWKRFL